MTPTPTAAVPNAEQITFPASYTPIGVAMLVVSALIVVAIMYVTIMLKIPLVLKVMLGLLAGSCFMMIKATLEDMSAVTITWTAQELVVARMLGSVSYPWSHIEGVKAFDAGATFADAGQNEEDGRAAIALQMRQSARVANPKDKTAQLAEVPPAMIISRAGDEAAKIPKAVQRLNIAKNTAGGGGDVRKFGAAASGGKSAKAFRRSQAAAAG